MTDDPIRRRHPGRPPLDPQDTPSVDVHVSLPARTYDRAYALARERGVSVPEVLRRAFLITLPDKPRDA